MSPPRLSISGMMMVVVVLGIDTALIRMAFASESQSFGMMGCECVFMALLSQFALVSAIRSRLRWRRFWSGFTVLGVFAAVGLIAESFWLHTDLLLPYCMFIQIWFGRRPGLQMFLSGHRVFHDLVAAAVFFAPQLAVAMVGGLLFACLGGRGAARLAGQEVPLPVEEGLGGTGT